MSEDQKKNLKELQSTQVEIQKEIREIEKKQTKETDKMELRITLLNVLAMPVLVVMGGLVVAIFRKSRTAAK